MENEEGMLVGELTESQMNSTLDTGSLACSHMDEYCGFLLGQRRMVILPERKEVR